MSVEACAALVRKGDPDRFLAVMAAPVAARARLFPLYAFNLEVARAPWAASQPMIAEMRLQWWRDVIEEAGRGAPPKAHEVAGPLAMLIREAGLPLDVLDRLVAARRHDAWGEPFEDARALDDYLDATGAGLMWLAARALGAPEAAEAVVRPLGWATGLANYLRAVPELTARGRAALPEEGEAAIATLARRGLAQIDQAWRGRSLLPREAVPALLAGWQSRALLWIAARDPAAVREGRLQLSEFARRGRLMWLALSGRW